MGKRGACHEKKSDKETQSPMLRIFREIMQREKAPEKDPENASLLKDRKKKKKKRKFFSHSSSQKHEDDSSPNEDPGPRIIQYDGRNKEQVSSIPQATSTEKQESWLYFAARNRTRGKRSKEKAEKEKNEAEADLEPKSTKDQDETFSCVSCALKKIVSNEYMCVGMLCIVFTISVVFAFCALFKAFPTVDVAQDKETNFDHGLDSDLFKKKIEHLSDSDKDLGLVKFGKRSDRSTWDEDKLPGNLNLLAGLRDNNNGDLNLESMNAVERNRALTDDLSRILASCKLNDVTDNIHIRDFYKKLLYTDAQIKRLKRLASRRRKDKKFYDRQKRAIFHRKHRFRTTKNPQSGNCSNTKAHQMTGGNKYMVAVQRVRDKRGRQRRQGHNITSQLPSGIVFEKKKLFVKFMKDDNVKFPKCSHASTIADNHNYPFAQHTQKLDEILDKLLDQQIPDIMRETPISRSETKSHFQTKTSRVMPQVNNEHKANHIDSTSERYTPSKTSEKYTPATHASAINFNDRTTTLKSTAKPNGPMNLVYETTANMYKNYIRPGMNKAKSKIKAEILKMLNAPTTTPSTTQMSIFTTQITSQKATEKYDLGFNKELTHRSTHKEATTTKLTENYDFDFLKQSAYRNYNKESKIGTTFMPGYDLILSVSTLINPSEKRVTKFTANEVLRRFPIRKLMQADDVEEEAIGYEDLKEVLSDDMQTHDEMDKSAEKKKRDINQIVAQSQLLHLVPSTSMPDPEPTQMKPTTLDVHNPNWKGPMPLYEDEINTMIKNAVIHNANKVAVPLNTKDISSELSMAESELNDVQYVEDYLSSKYDKLVKMAQAYSDYGVLNAKKDEWRLEKNEMPNVKLDNRVKMLGNDSFYDLDETLYKRSKESVDTEDSTSNSALAKDRNPFKAIANYFKPAKDKNLESVRKSTDSDNESISSQSTNKIRNEDFMIFNTREKRSGNKLENMKLSEDVSNSSWISKNVEIMNENRKIPRRSLKSVDSDEVSEEILSRDYYDTTSDSPFLHLYNTFHKNATYYDFDHESPFNETNEDLSDIDVTTLKKNRSAVKLLYYNKDNVFEKYAMPLSTNKSIDDIGYEQYQDDEYPESDYRYRIMTFTASKDNTTDNFTSTDTDILGVIFELNLDKREVFLNKTTILGDDYNIPDVKINNSEKDIQERILLLDKTLSINNQSYNTSYMSENLNSNAENITNSKDLNNIIYEEKIGINREYFKNQSRPFIIRVDPMVNILSIILKEQNKSLVEHKTNPEISSSTQSHHDIIKNVSFEDFFNNTRKKRLIYNDKNGNISFFNETERITEKSIENGTNIEVIQPNGTKFDPSEFFLLASNFFSSISGIFFDKEIENNPLLKFVALLTYTNNTNATVTNTTSVNKTKTKTVNVENSMYDSEMVDNIGHRSRVLLSIEENSNIIDNETERSIDSVRSTVEGPTKLFTTETETNDVQSNTTGLTTQTYATQNNFSKTKENINTPQDKSKENKISFQTKKSVVKRSAIEDSNLIFWNDMYDEEYGVQTDPLENTIRDKNSMPGNALMKKSGVWLQDKMKRIGESLKKQSRDGLDKIYGSRKRMRKSRDSRGLDMFFKKRDDQKSKDSAFDNDLFKEKENPKINSLPQLSVHMKKVCEEAAKAVQMRQSMKADVATADSQKSDEELSVNLMQNLVRLLSDLVDYQVQLKTCNKLPEDLHQFLLWLKAPVMDSKDEKSMMNDESRAKIIESLTQTQANPTGSTPQPRLNKIQISPSSKISTRMSKLPTPNQAWPTEREDIIQPEERAEYIGALHAVQDLLRQYEMMNAEDKTKMAGVKDYLENQLFYLSRQLYPNEYSYSHLYSQNPNQNRIKRDSSTKSKRHAPFKPGRHSYRQRRHNQSNYKLRGKANKFVKSFGKKHTRTTAGSYDNVDLTTEVKKETVNKKIDKDEEKGFVKRGADNKASDKDNKNEKRSLLNVYYQAVEESKKSSTMKNVKRNLDLDLTS